MGTSCLHYREELSNLSLTSLLNVPSEKRDLKTWDAMLGQKWELCKVFTAELPRWIITGVGGIHAPFRQIQLIQERNRATSPPQFNGAVAVKPFAYWHDNSRQRAEGCCFRADIFHALKEERAYERCPHTLITLVHACAHPSDFVSIDPGVSSPRSSMALGLVVEAGARSGVTARLARLSDPSGQTISTKALETAPADSRTGRGLQGLTRHPAMRNRECRLYTISHAKLDRTPVT